MALSISRMSAPCSVSMVQEVMMRVLLVFGLVLSGCGSVVDSAGNYCPSTCAGLDASGSPFSEDVCQSTAQPLPTADEYARMAADYRSELGYVYARCWGK